MTEPKMNNNDSHPVVNLLTDDSGDLETKLNRFIKAFNVFYINDFTHLKAMAKSNASGIKLNRWMIGFAIGLGVCTVGGIIAVLCAIVQVLG